jgi:hypothetical protein
MKRAAIMVAVLCSALGNSLWAQEPSVMLSTSPGWHKIGEVKADFKVENESIAVLGADKFRSILLKVTDAPINIQNVQVTYENDEVEDFDVKNELKANSETRKIDLKDPTKAIKRVTFTYKTLPNQKAEKAHIELYGLK